METKPVTILCSSCPEQMTVPTASAIPAQTLWNSRACERFGQKSLDHSGDWDCRRRFRPTSNLNFATNLPSIGDNRANHSSSRPKPALLATELSIHGSVPASRLRPSTVGSSGRYCVYCCFNRHRRACIGRKRRASTSNSPISTWRKNTL